MYEILFNQFDTNPQKYYFTFNNNNAILTKNIIFDNIVCVKPSYNKQYDNNEYPNHETLIIIEIQMHIKGKGI